MLIGILNSVKPSFGNKLRMNRIHFWNTIRLLTFPSGVVPLDKGSLSDGGRNDLHEVSPVQRVGVGDEKRVEMSGRHTAGYLRAMDKNDIVIICR